MAGISSRKSLWDEISVRSQLRCRVWRRSLQRYMCCGGKRLLRKAKFTSLSEAHGAQCGTPTCWTTTHFAETMLNHTSTLSSSSCAYRPVIHTGDERKLSRRGYKRKECCLRYTRPVMKNLDSREVLLMADYVIGKVGSLDTLHHGVHHNWI